MSLRKTDVETGYKALTKTMHFVLMPCEQANGSANVKKQRLCNDRVMT